MEKKCLILVSIIVLSTVFGSLVWLQEAPRSSHESKSGDSTNDIEVPDNTVVYNYNASTAVTITDGWYPIGNHLCVEVSTSLYFVPFQATNTIRKLNTTTGVSTLIVTEAGAITKMYYDRTNGKLYYYQTQSIISYILLSNDSIVDLDGTLVGVDDIFVYSNSVFAVDCSQDDLTFYKYTAGTPGSWGAVGTVAEGSTNSYNIGALGNNDNLGGICKLGDYFYIVDTTDAAVYKYNLVLDTLVATYNIGALGGNDNPTYICTDGTFFYVLDSLDDVVYKYPSDFSVLTASYDISIMTNGHAGICWDGTNFFIPQAAVASVYKFSSSFVFVSNHDVSDLGIISIDDICWDGIYFYLKTSAVYSKVNSSFTALLEESGVGVLGGNDNPYAMTWSNNYFYVTDSTDALVYQYSSDLKTELGTILYHAIISDKAYTVYKYPTTAAKIYVKDLDDASNPSLLETLTTTAIIPYLDDQRGIAVSNDNDTLFFVMKYSNDLKTYLCSYKISTDAFTKNGEFNVSLQLDRNCNSAGTDGFNLEKAFGTSSTDGNQLMVYQIPSNFKGNLWKISDLTDLLTGYTIKFVSDTYLIVYNGTLAKTITYTSMNAYILSSWITHAVRSWAKCVIEYDSDKIKYTEGMGVSCVNTFKGVENKVIFEGYCKDVKDVSTSNPRLKKAHFVNYSYDDLVNGYPSGTKTGRVDEHLVDDLGDCDYCRAGTNNTTTTALGSIPYGGGVQRIVVWNAWCALNSFTWWHRPKGYIDSNNGAVDSTVNYLDNSAPKINNATVKDRPIVYNYVSTEGAYVSGVKLVCVTPAQDKALQHTVLKKAITITIPFANTTGLLDSWATSLLSLLGGAVNEVTFKILDSTNKFLQVGEEITLTLANNTYRTIAASQYKIDKIEFNDRTGLAWYWVSSRVFYEKSEFERVDNSNDENLGQLAGTVVSHTSSAITAAHSAGNWKLFHSNGSGVITELALGAANLNLQSNGVAAAPTFAQPDHINLASIGTNTHAQIDTHIGLTATAHGGIDAQIHQDLISGGGGFILEEGTAYGACYAVACSDTSASISVSWYVPVGGTFRLMFIYDTDGANNGKTAAGRAYVSAMTTGEVQSNNLLSNVVCSLPLANAWILTFYTFASNLSVSSGDHVHLQWLKNDNAGGAASSLHIYGVVLIRQ